jgi:hypothetical protein
MNFLKNIFKKEPTYNASPDEIVAFFFKKVLSELPIVTYDDILQGTRGFNELKTAWGCRSLFEGNKSEAKDILLFNLQKYKSNINCETIQLGFQPKKEIFADIVTVWRRSGFTAIRIWKSENKIFMCGGEFYASAQDPEWASPELHSLLEQGTANALGAKISEEVNIETMVDSLLSYINNIAGRVLTLSSNSTPYPKRALSILHQIVDQHKSSIAVQTLQRIIQIDDVIYFGGFGSGLGQQWSNELICTDLKKLAKDELLHRNVTT